MRPRVPRFFCNPWHLFLIVPNLHFRHTGLFDSNPHYFRCLVQICTSLPITKGLYSSFSKVMISDKLDQKILLNNAPD